MAEGLSGLTCPRAALRDGRCEHRRTHLSPEAAGHGAPASVCLGGSLARPRRTVFPGHFLAPSSSRRATPRFA